MFFLFGEKDHATQKAAGAFNCPLCLTNTRYTHQHVQPSFTLFGISIAKLDVSSDYVICHQCDSCYAPQVINKPEEHNLAVDKAVLLRTLCYLLSGYGNTQQSKDRLINIYQQYTNIDIAYEDIRTEVNVINAGHAPTLPFLKEHSVRLSPKAKHSIILACYQFADGSSMMEHQDRVRINTIASSLGISLPEVAYLINTLAGK